MSDIDWNEAPEGATHWEIDNQYASPSWVRKDADGEWSFWGWNCRGWIPMDCPNPERMRFIYPRPTPWTGDGLPPVGEVCEVSVSHINDGAWTAVEILAHAKHDSDDAVLVREKNLGTMHGVIYDRSWFRPIRTPEQIAEEERKAAIEEMIRAIHPGDINSAITKGLYSVLKQAMADLYDAGYRKAGDV